VAAGRPVAPLDVRRESILQIGQPGPEHEVTIHMAGNNMLEFTEQNFEDQVLKSGKPVLVDFWAPWCAPCRMMTPTVEAVAKEYADRAVVGKINVDDNQNIAGRYNIRGIPTLLLFKGGEIQEQVVGATSKDAVVKMIEKHLG
jgi:thioredoxin 1